MPNKVAFFFVLIELHPPTRWESKKPNEARQNCAKILTSKCSAKCVQTNKPHVWLSKHKKVMWLMPGAKVKH